MSKLLIFSCVLILLFIRIDIIDAIVYNDRQKGGVASDWVQIETDPQGKAFDADGTCRIIRCFPHDYRTDRTRRNGIHIIGGCCQTCESVGRDNGFFIVHGVLIMLILFLNTLADLAGYEIEIKEENNGTDLRNNSNRGFPDLRRVVCGDDPQD